VYVGLLGSNGLVTSYCMTSYLLHNKDLHADVTIFSYISTGVVFQGKGEIMTWWLRDESSPDCQIRPAPCGETGVHWDRPVPSGETELHWDRPAPCGETGVHWDRPAPCGETGVHWNSSIQSFY